MWFSVVCTLIDNSTGHTVVKFCYETISSSDTSTKRETATLICPPTIIVKWDAILRQWEREDFYNHPSNYTKEYIYILLCYIMNEASEWGNFPQI